MPPLLFHLTLNAFLWKSKSFFREIQVYSVLSKSNNWALPDVANIIFATLRKNSIEI